MPFQRRFLRRAFAPGITTSCLSFVAQGKWEKHVMASYLLTRCLSPGDTVLNKPGAEYLLLGAAIHRTGEDDRIQGCAGRAGAAIPR